MLERLINNAKGSSFHLWILNQALKFVIPFNRPHLICIKKIGEREVVAFLPYRYSNFNHIKGTHACAMAAAAEFSTGILLLATLSPSRYRIIMETLSMSYHYQAKKDAVAICSIDADWIRSAVLEPLTKSDRTSVTVISELHDVDGNHLATGTISWQIKEWSKVRTS